MRTGACRSSTGLVASSSLLEIELKNPTPLGGFFCAGFVGFLERSTAISSCERPERPAPESSAPGLVAVELERPPNLFCSFGLGFAEFGDSSFIDFPSGVEIAPEAESSVFFWDPAGNGLTVEVKRPPDSLSPSGVGFAELGSSFSFGFPSGVDTATEVNCFVFLWDPAGRGSAIGLDGPADLVDSVAGGLRSECDWCPDRGGCAVGGGPGVERNGPVGVADSLTGREAGFEFGALDRLADLIVGRGRAPALS